jgi:hypothetical protein
MNPDRYDDPIWGDLFREADEEWDQACAKAKKQHEKKHGKLKEGQVWGARPGKKGRPAELVPVPDPKHFLELLKGTDMRTYRTPSGAVPKKDPDEQIKAVLAPLERVAAELEDKWGRDRLCGLVDEEMAGRFGSAAAKLEEARRGKNIEQIKKKAEVMRRGWMKLDELAEAAGHEPWQQPDVWEGRQPDGTVFLIAKDRSTAIAAHKQSGVGVWTLEEIGKLIQHHDPQGLTQAMKDTFDAELVSCSATNDDNLPF